MYGRNMVLNHELLATERSERHMGTRAISTARARKSD